MSVVDDLEQRQKEYMDYLRKYEEDPKTEMPSWMKGNGKPSTYADVCKPLTEGEMRTRIAIVNAYRLTFRK